MNEGSAVVFALLMALASCSKPPCGTEIGDLCLLAGTGSYSFNQDGLLPEDTDLFLPSAARRGPDGFLYIMDFNNQRLRRIGDDGRVETVVGSGFHGIASIGTPILDTPLENPIDFGFLSDGRVVFLSYHDPRVLEIAEDGTLRTIAGAAEEFAGTIGNEGDGGPAIDAMFIQLDGIAVAPDDTIYISDSLANRVRKIEDGIITTVAGTGEAGFGGDGGPATAAMLYWPTALELDDDGNLYIADTLNHAVRRLDVDGTITTVVGNGLEGKGGDGGPAIAAQLSENSKNGGPGAFEARVSPAKGHAKRGEDSNSPSAWRARMTGPCTSPTVATSRFVESIPTGASTPSPARACRAPASLDRRPSPRSGSPLALRSTATIYWWPTNPTARSGACGCADASGCVTGS